MTDDELTTAVDAALADPTGDPAADAGLAELARLPDTELDQHADVYTDVHRRLSDALADEDA
jgi:hypothetical protein